MFACDSLAKSLWCKLSLHITLFEPTADFQWWITRHYITFIPMTETKHPLLYWFAIECGMIHLSVFRPPEVTMSWGNGVCTMTDGEWPGKSLCSFEAEIHLWNIVFVYHSVLLKVTREVHHPYPSSLHNSVHQCSPMGTGSIHIPVFWLTVSPTKICLLGSGGVIDGMFSFTSPPPHALLLWIEMPYSFPLLMGSYTVGETQRGQALSFLPQVSLYLLPPPSALKRNVHLEKSAPCCQCNFYPQGKPGW